MENVRLLVIDTCGETAGVAVCVGARVVAEVAVSPLIQAAAVAQVLIH